MLHNNEYLEFMKYENEAEQLIQSIEPSFFLDSCQENIFHGLTEDELFEQNQKYNFFELEKNNRKSNKILKYSFFLKSTGLFYQKQNKNTFKQIPFEFARVVFAKQNEDEENQKYFIYFSLKQKTIKVMCTDIFIIKKIRNSLLYKSIQHTFHEDFDVKKIIGKGSFAKVYLAIKKETNLLYAIKAFNKEYLLAQNFGKESLINEISIMRVLDHKNLLKLFEVFETKHSIYLVLELISGGDLIKGVREKRNISTKDISIFMQNLLLALEHIHEKGVMHRDLKPENILLRSSNQIYDLVIADFGLSTFINKKVKEIFFKRCGTPGFVAPEILNFKENGEIFYNEKCDLFSAGIIFYILLTGKKPFNGKDFKDILRQNKISSFDFTGQIFKDLPENAFDLLKKLLIVFPQVRCSAKQALSHKYFQFDNINITKTNPEKIEIEEENKIIEINNNPNQTKIIDLNYTMNENPENSPFSPNLTSMSPLMVKKPLLNGNIDTIEKIGENVNSNFTFEQSPISPNQSNLGFSKLALETIHRNSSYITPNIFQTPPSQMKVLVKKKSSFNKTEFINHFFSDNKNNGNESNNNK